MTVTVSSIRDAIAAAIDVIDGLRVFDIVPDQVPVPAAVVGWPDRIQFDATMQRGKDRYTFLVRLYASRVSDRAGQDKLDSFLAKSGSSSLKAAIESDHTLGGAVDTCRVAETRGYGAYIIGGIDYIGVEFVIDVLA